MDGAKKKLIEGLNEDLANEYSAIIMYRCYASMVKGPYRQELRTFFSGEVPDELTHAELLADKIVALGGTPTTEPKPVKLSDDARVMLENALIAEKETIMRYVKRRRQAEEVEDYGLAVELDNLIADESKHRDELELMLEKWD